MVVGYIRLAILVACFGAPLASLSHAGSNADDAYYFNSPEEKWGKLIDVIAALTWAEINCVGHLPEEVRELRLYLRKNAHAEFEEALIKDVADRRETSADLTISDTDFKWVHCNSIKRRYGEEGSSLPGLWRTDSGRLSEPRKQQPTEFLGKYGQFVSILAEINYKKSSCSGYITPLANVFTKAFIGGGGEDAFNKLFDAEMAFLPQFNSCRSLDHDYSSAQKEWPPLWVPRRVQDFNGRDVAGSQPTPSTDPASTDQVVDLRDTIWRREYESNFVPIKLPRGIEVQIPRGWWMLGSKLLNLIDTAAEAAMDLSGFELPPDGQRVVLLAANSLPTSTYAAIRINSTAPPSVPPSQLEATFNRNAALEEMRFGLAQGLPLQGNRLIDVVDVRLEKISGFPAIVTEYRRTGQKGSVWVQINRIITDTQEISVNLSYRESEHPIWKPVTLKIRESLVIAR